MHALFLLLSTSLAAPVTVDATRSVVLTNSETLAMGGASVGAAVGADGAFYNPAAAGRRSPGDTKPLFYSTSFGALDVGPANPVDLGNIGAAEGWSGGMLNLGLAVGYKRLALSVVNGRLRYYTSPLVDDIGTIYTPTVNVNETHLDLAAAFAEDRVILGAGARLLRVGASLDGYGLEPERFGGVGAELGLLLRSPATGLSLGLVWRQGTSTGDLDEVSALGVRAVELPAELALGAAWSGELRPAQANPLPLRLVADLVLASPVEEAFMLEALMLGEQVAKGRAASWSPRLGAELEPWPDRLRLRAGTYLEPSRTDLADGRLHGTGGLELRLFRLRLLRGIIDMDISYEAAIDAAPRYLNLSYLGVGTWARRAKETIE